MDVTLPFAGSESEEENELQSLVAWRARMAQTNAHLDEFQAELNQGTLERLQATDLHLGSEAALDPDAEGDEKQSTSDPSQSLPHSTPPVLRLDDSAIHTESGREHLELFAKYRQDEELRLAEKERRRLQEVEHLKAQLAEEKVQFWDGY